MAGLIDVDKEIARLTRQRERLSSDLDKSSRKLSNENFIANAPRDVVDKERARTEELSGAIGKIDEQLEAIARLGAA